MHACDKLDQLLAPKPADESEKNQWFRDYCALLNRDSLESDAAGRVHAGPRPASIKTMEEERRESKYDAKA